MCGISKEVLESFDKLIDYNYADEQKNYEILIERSLTDDEINDPDLLEHQDHIFYHILVIQNWINS